MEKTMSLNSLQIGQRVKVKGRPGGDGTFQALEVSVKPPDDQVAIEGKIQALDAQQNSLRLMNRDFVLPAGAEIKDVQRQSVPLSKLKIGEVVKLKGTYSATAGLRIERVKMQESKGFSIEELQGDINKIDPEKKTLDVLGITVVLSEKTEIEGLPQPRTGRRER